MILDRLFQRRDRGIVDPAHPRDPAIARLFGGGPYAAGQIVTPETAMRVATVFACIRVISETLAHLPRKLLEKDADGNRREVLDHRLSRPFKIRPNAWQTPMEFTEMLTAWIALNGIGYARIAPADNAGNVHLVPMHPYRTRVVQLDDGRLIYNYTTSGGKVLTLLQEEVLRIPFMVLDGITPVSPIGAAREVMGGALAAQDFANRFYQNDLTSGYWIEYPGNFETEEDLARFRKTLRDATTGDNVRSPPILEDGVKLHTLSMNMKDAQWIDSRKFSRDEICAIYRVPPHMVQNLERATNNNIEQQSLEFVIYTLSPWIVRWEQAMRRDLLREDEQDRYFFEFNVMGLLRGDVKTRYGAYAVGRQWGWLSVNDILELENKNKIGPEGDIRLQPMNMTGLGEDQNDDTDEGGGSDAAAEA